MQQYEQKIKIKRRVVVKKLLTTEDQCISTGLLWFSKDWLLKSNQIVTGSKTKLQV